MRSSAKSQIEGSTTGQMTQFHHQINCKEKKREKEEEDEEGSIRLKDAEEVFVHPNVQPLSQQHYSRRQDNTPAVDR